MTIPANFPAHWRKAVEHGDASGFTDEADAVAFFTATKKDFGDLTMDQRGNVADLRTHPDLADLFSIAVARLHGKAEAASFLAAKAKSPRFGAHAAATTAEQPHKPASSWDAAIAAVNARVSGG